MTDPSDHDPPLRGPLNGVLLPSQITLPDGRVIEIVSWSPHVQIGDRMEITITARIPMIG